MAAKAARRLTEKTGLTLDDLAGKSSAALAALYRKGTLPASMKALDGAPRGRMLAVRGLEKTPLAKPTRLFAGSEMFVWGGKSFQSTGTKSGMGVNRVSVPGVLGSQNLFPFDTLFGPSAVDGKPALILDYDKTENPPYIRKIHDEVRQVSPGVFLGPAMWKGAAQKIHLLWFALDTNDQSI